MVNASHATSTSGTSFDGAVFGSNAVFFPVSASATVTTTIFTVPSAVTTVIITGLKPGGSYGVKIISSLNGRAVVLNPGGAGSTADAGGVLLVAA